LATVAAAIVALVVVGLPLRADTEVRASEHAVADGRLDDALSDAKAAADAEPFAATPRLQEALVLERQGKFDQAVEDARAATQKESTNWRTWFTLSRIEAEAGNAKASLDAYRRARQLNPRSGVFTG
jgi:Flp pilus assembly protein TadD